MAAYKVIMVRHGESVYNEENRFCGWFDADLAETGLREAQKAGRMLHEKGVTFDLAFTSVLQRAIKTLFYICEEMHLHWVPVIKDWHLNERNYGALTGLNKAETAAKHGEDQVKIWRRAYDVPPPPLEDDDERYPGNDPRYRVIVMLLYLINIHEERVNIFQGIDRHLIPHTECLKDTVERVIPFWQNVVVPEIKRGRKVIIAAHGNSIRALSKYLDGISDQDIIDLNIPTAIPIVYELNGDMKPIQHYYTASDDEVKAALDKVAAQGKAAKK